MKYCLILLLAPFFASAQEVVIPADVARYFLEQSDRAKILAEKDSLNLRRISVESQELAIKQSVIESYKKDSLTYTNIISNKDSIMVLKDQDVNLLKKQIHKKSFQVHLLVGTTSGAVVGTVVPVIGTFTGILVGGATGTIVYLVKAVTRSKFK